MSPEVISEQCKPRCESNRRCWHEGEVSSLEAKKWLAGVDASESGCGGEWGAVGKLHLVVLEFANIRPSMRVTWV